MNNKIENIKNKYIEEITLDKPINIKIDNSNLCINSVLMKDYYKFVVCQEILNIDKNSINDPAIIQMQYMEFLINLLMLSKDEDQKRIYVSLYEILSIVLRTDKLDLSVECDGKNKPYFKINNLIIKKNDFDLIRRIIMIQNIPNYNEDYIDPFLKEDLKKAQKLNNNGHEQVDIEHKITFLSMVSGMNLEEIYNMPIRKFMIMLEMEAKYTSYKIMKQASMSGMVEFKKEIPHYMDEIEVSVGIDYDSFKNKINNA